MADDHPPSLNETDDYERWRDNLQQWRCSTQMEGKRQALAVRSKLSGKARDIALSLDAADLNNDTGMDFLLGKLDGTFRKEKKNKWDVPAPNAANQNGRNEPPNNGTSTMTAAERARQRASELSAKLVKEGKYQTKPMSLLPAGSSNPVDQFKMANANTSVGSPANLAGRKRPPPLPMPEVMKKDTGGYFAKIEINDLPARPFLIKHTTHELILQKTGCGASLRGRYMNPEEKRMQIVSGLKEMPLTLVLEADISAKVQVAVHKVMDVCRNYEKNPDNTTNNYGLAGNPNQHQQNNHHFVQDKVFVGLESMNPQFDMKSKLLGIDGANFGYIAQQSGAKIFLRGKGSGYLEQNSGRESFEALHIYASHPRQDGLVTARQLCANLIETVRNQYHEWQNLTQEEQDRSFSQNGGPNTGGAHYTPPAQAYSSTPGLQMRHGTTNDMSYRAAPPPQALYQQQQRPRFEQFHRPPFSVNQQRPMYGGYPPHPANVPLQYPPHPNQHMPRPPMAAGGNYGSSDYNNRYTPYDAERSREEQPRNSKYQQDRERRSRSRSPRSPSERRQRSRSRERDQSPPRSPSRRSSRRSPSRRSPPSSHRQHLSPDGQSPSRRSPGRSAEKPRRKFTEEPKKRRKFSEDPKLLEQSKKRIEIDSTPTERVAVGSSAQPSKLRPKFKEKPAIDAAMPPPPSFPVPLKVPVKKKDEFPKPPIPPMLAKRVPKVSRLGALGSLIAYDDGDDSD